MVEQHYRFCLFMAGGGGFAYHHTIVLVAVVFQSETGGKLAKEVGHTFLMMRGARYLVQLSE